MKRTKKPTWIAVTVIVLVLCTICVGAMTDSGMGENENWSWTLTDGTLTISGEGEMDSYEGVSDIPWRAYRRQITSAVIDEGITSICNYAFFDCTALRSVTISDSVTTINDTAFGWCETLSSILLPTGVTTIGNNAFIACGNLTDISIPSSVTTIGNNAFSACSSLTHITIPAAVTEIGKNAFGDCDALTWIRVEEDNMIYSSDENGVLFDKAKTSLFRYPCGSELTTYAIPNSVVYIAEHAFTRAVGLTSLLIPSGVQYIEYNALWYCDSLVEIRVEEGSADYFSDESGVLFNKDKTILMQYPCGNTQAEYTIPQGVNTIGNHAFAGCAALTSVTLPDGVISIRFGAFAECSNLTMAVIPESVTNFYVDIFSDVSPDFTICGILGSAAETYANENGFPFVSMEHDPVEPTFLLGDITGDGIIDIADALLLFKYSMMPDLYPVPYEGDMDFTVDGILDIFDALKLFQYSLMPDVYPLA